jgi:hypothetical protein
MEMASAELVKKLLNTVMCAVQFVNRRQTFQPVDIRPYHDLDRGLTPLLSRRAPPAF